MSAFTRTADVSVDVAAYNLAMDYALRPELYFDRLADVKPTAQPHPGSTVLFTLTADLSAVTTALNESTDVTTVAMSDSQVTVTLAEYGNAVKTTAKLRGTSFLTYDPVVANVVGFNAGISLDTICRNELVAGDNVRYGGTAAGRTTVVPTSTLTAANVRRTLADLRGANVQSFNGYYAAFIHPDVSYDLRGETGAAAWRDPHTYSSPENIWSGEVGAFEGHRFVESPRIAVVADAGSSTTLTDVYLNLFMGRQALAKAFSYTDGNGAMPKVVDGPVIDVLRRFRPLGWYWLGGYKRYREASLRRFETASSIGSN